MPTCFSLVFQLVSLAIRCFQNLIHFLYNTQNFFLDLEIERNFASCAKFLSPYFFNPYLLSL